MRLGEKRKVDDELDHRGPYFTHNNYLDAALRISSDGPTMWRGYKEPIDQYYHALSRARNVK